MDIINSAVEKARKRYLELFPDDKSKAEAFDAIAEKYYFANFGSLSKADMDVLMFSRYIEQILKVSEENSNTYSDYTLSKLLGITQAKISNLKVKKELQYPYADFSWQRSFERIVGNYRYENGKIKLFIPDKNLYLELKNIIEERNGYIETTLNPTLLQIAPEYFVDLLLVAAHDEDRDILIEKVRSELSKHKIDSFDPAKKSVGETLKYSLPNMALEITCNLLEEFIPVVGTVLASALREIVKSIRN